MEEEWTDSLPSDDDEYSEGKQEEDFDLDQSGLEDDDLLTSVPPAQRLKRSMSFAVLPEDEIAKESFKLIQETMQLCHLPSQAAACTLLRFFKWNKEKLLESYLENSDKVLEKAGIMPFEMTSSTLEANQEPLECLICMETFGPSQVFSLCCGHRYCKGCWKEYLEVKIKDGPICISARCPAPKCKAIVNENAFKTLVDEASFKKYEHYLARSFVENNDYVKWCPSPGCIYAVKSENSRPKKSASCLCGYQFCFNCADSDIGAHTPAPCDQVEKWKQKSKDESENVKWMLQNTKKCPKCRSPIEKNGGCMHMTCRNANCMYEFCWLCRGPWTEHGQATGGFYACNKFDPSKDKKDYGEKADSKTELETYMFYIHRYESHKNALKIAGDQRTQSHQRAQKFMDSVGVRSSDTRFLTDVTEQLIANRRVLQFSYVMGYFLDKSKEAEKNLFEYLQEDLEKHTNDLTDRYEKGCASVCSYNDFMKWKEEMSNKVRVSAKFLGNFLEGVAEGLLANK